MRIATIVLVGWIAAACSQAASTSSASPTVMLTVSPSASPVASPRLEVPLALLDVRAGSDVTRPGLIPPGPGGSLTLGPETIAIDDGGVVWLFDQAKSRAAAYDKGIFLRAVALTDVPRGARGLLVTGGRIYLRIVDDSGTSSSELELDATTGRLARRADLRQGATTIYPFERIAFGSSRAAQKGVADLLGHDALGNRYERSVSPQWTQGQCFSVIRRITPAGIDLAEACFDIGGPATDYFVARDGAVYQLEQLYTGTALDRFAVTRVMSPAK